MSTVKTKRRCNVTERVSPTKSGVVAMLDALGTSSVDAKGARNFIKIRNELIKETQTDFDRTINQCKHMVDEFDPSAKFSPPKVVTFADNVVFCWGSPPERVNSAETNLLTQVYLLYLCQYLGVLIKVALSKGLLWRGAIGVGEYIYFRSSNTLLGPAVNDAASWYDKADWIGIIATPSCGMRLSALKNFKEAQDAIKPINSQSSLKLSTFCTEYDITMKGGAKQMLWAVSWPAQYLSIEPDRKTNLGGEQVFWYVISRLMIPPGAESKYKNTVEFFQWFKENIKVD